ncbi:MAG: thrombospondin type 3 repeat-containing protein [Saprospiraceae bacterium]|nr:thrombospondin type 3 repeat-containing protein [Saprospiraceae bacterium]
MKKLITLILVMGCCTILFSQNPDYDRGIGFKRVFTDYRSMQGGDFSKFRSYRPAWEVGYHHKLIDNLNLHVPLRAGVFSTSEEDANNRSFFSLDAQAIYYWQKPDWVFRPFLMAGAGFVKEFDGDFVPQIPLGGGVYVKMNDRAYIQWQSEFRLAFMEDRSNLQHGIGFIYLLGPAAQKEMMEEKKEKEMEVSKPDSDGDGIPDEEDLCPNIAGEAEYIGCPDSDGDGLHDVIDKCPETAGLKEMSGCPDSDGDGLSDSEDKCPNLAGIASNDGCPAEDDDNDGLPNHLDDCPFDVGPEALNGCPDSDGDGVADKDDDCPNVRGSKDNMGCPKVMDSDNDGIADNQDDCPDQAGTIENNGCPEGTDSDGDGVIDARDDCPNTVGLIAFNGCPDTDGDGIEDSKDSCPRSAGPADNGGCPEISKEDKRTLEIAMRAVQFSTGRSTLKTESFRILNQVAEIMRKYPDYNLMISGHTDNSGSATVNQRLSEKRAQTCYEYLISRGIASKRMGYTGYGETRPVADNATAEGRYLNRRVEFDLIPASQK